MGIEHLSLKFVDLDKATDQFSEENIIGEGGFGKVYKVNQLNIFSNNLTVFFYKLELCSHVLLYIYREF